MKLICIGRNYADHIDELKNERPDEPVVFMKPDSAILPKDLDFYIPEFSNDVHYEVEVLVKIKKVGSTLMKSLPIPITMKSVWVLILRPAIYNRN